MARDMTAGGYAVTKSFEGRALKSYKDCVGVWTIGYGNTNYDKFATDYLKRQIGPGITITNDEAEYLLHESMKRKYLPQCEKAMGPEASDGAFDASGSFHYNTGAIGRASWVPKFRRGEDYEGSLLSWNKGGGKVLAGLTRRRKREYAMAKHNDYGPEGRNAPPTLSAGGHVNGTVATPSPAATPAEPTAPTATPVEHIVHAGMLQKGDKHRKSPTCKTSWSSLASRSRSPEGSTTPRIRRYGHSNMRIRNSIRMVWSDLLLARSSSGNWTPSGS
jgi:GH24 family phage-related lysozyme (muramidase)